MDKAHDIQKVEFIGTTMLLHVDGKKCEIEIAEWSGPLAGRPMRICPSTV